jgi:hypothetical protein
MRDKLNVQREVCFKVPICFIIGDVEGHDLLCGRYSSHQTKRLCRECDCPMEDSDNGFIECTYTMAKCIKELRDSNNLPLLQEIGYHSTIPQTNACTDSQARTYPHTDTRTDTRTDTLTIPQTNTCTDSKARTYPRTDTRTDTKTHTRTNARTDSQTHTLTDYRPDTICCK